MSFFQRLDYLNSVRRESLATYTRQSTWLRRQQRRLRRLVKYAAKHSPFYAQKYQGIDLSGITLDALPTVRKSELIESSLRQWTDKYLLKDEVYRFLSDLSNVGTWYQDKYCVYKTSGTTGSGLVILQDRNTIKTLLAVMGARSRGNRRPSIREAIRRWLEPQRVAVVTHQVGFYPSRATLSFMPGLVGKLIDMKHFASTQEDLTEALNDFQPHSIFGYASVLDRLATRATNFTWTSLESISNSSEQLTAAIRRRLETAFRVPVIDHYGAGECLQIADTCEFGRMHVNSDWAIIESVDKQLRPVSPGTAGDHVLVTNLLNHVQPFIRYVLDDQVVLSAGTQCSCGCSFPVIESFMGRTSDQIVVTRIDGSQQLLPGVLFHSVLDEIPMCGQWRIVQCSPNSLQVDIQETTSFEAKRSESSYQEYLVKQLNEKGVPAWVRIQINFTKDIPNDPTSGKFRRFITLKA